MSWMRPGRPSSILTAVLTLLALLTLLFGVAPNLIFNLTEGAALSILSLMAGG